MQNSGSAAVIAAGLSAARLAACLQSLRPSGRTLLSIDLAQYFILIGHSQAMSGPTGSGNPKLTGWATVKLTPPASPARSNPVFRAKSAKKIHKIVHPPMEIDQVVG